MIVEAVRSDSFAGSTQLIPRERSRYKCASCDVTYEYIVHAEPGEWDAIADPLPVHFELLSDRVDSGHTNGHQHIAMATDGVRSWSPQQQEATLAWTQ